MKKTKDLKSTLLAVAVILSFWPGGSALAQEDSWPKRVLITNDNGIEDIKIIELAKAFSQIAETYVVAPMEDRSGSTHYLTATKAGKLIAEPRNIGQGITAYAVDGFPADCVVLALLGIMRNNPPDLVISGINGGPNLGKDWIFSGTVGAARVAAFAGLPAVAVSGLDDDMPGAVEKVCGWVVKLAQSRFIRGIRPPAYITVSFPRISPDNIKGVRFAERAWLREKPIFSKTASKNGEGGHETWAITGTETISSPLSPECDISLHDKGYITIVPMIADEHNRGLLKNSKQNIKLIPDFK